MLPIRFDDLELEEKAQVVVNKGSFVSKVMFHQLTIYLYRMNDSFVEVWYNPATRNLKKVVYLSAKKINPYVKYLYTPSLN